MGVVEGPRRPPRLASSPRAPAPGPFQHVTAVRPSADGLLYLVADDEFGILDVDLDGRRVWSFRETGRTRPDQTADWRFQPWPAPLRPRLQGRFRVRLRASGADDGPAAEVSLDGSDEPLRLEDRFGRPLVVNKWGRLGLAITDAPPGFVDRLLDTTDDVRAVLEEKLGPVVYVTGGTLLGPVREHGRLLPHDDDADLAYLSGHAHPADLALEMFELSRALRAAGHTVLRLSIGHLTIVVDRDGVPDHFVDVFTGFLLDGYWYQVFPVRTPADRDELLPPSTVVVEGRKMPAPRRPEVMLEALFGSGWRVPDPAFEFDVPPSTGHRFYGWFGDWDVGRHTWEDEYLLAERADRRGEQPSALALELHERVPAEEALLELGCSSGADALALAAAGRRVHGVDYVRHAVADAAAEAERHGLDAAFEPLNLLDTRAVVRLGARLAAEGPPWSVLGRRLLSAVPQAGRDNVFRLCGMLLRRGTAATFDLVDDAVDLPAPYERIGPEQVAAEAARHGLHLVAQSSAVEPLAWPGRPGEEAVPVHRLTFGRRTR